MKLPILMLAFMALVGLPQMAKAMDETATVKAVAFHSDNCGSCKILGPKVDAAIKQIDSDKVQKITFNFTDKTTIAETKALAMKEGVSDVLNKYGAKSGFVVLLDQNGQEVDKLKASDSTEDIASKITKAIASKS